MPVTDRQKTIWNGITIGVSCAVAVAILTVGFSVYANDGKQDIKIQGLENIIPELKRVIVESDTRAARSDGEIRALVLANTKLTSEINAKLEMLLRERDKGGK